MPTSRVLRIFKLGSGSGGHVLCDSAKRRRRLQSEKCEKREKRQTKHSRRTLPAQGVSAYAQTCTGGNCTTVSSTQRCDPPRFLPKTLFIWWHRVHQPLVPRVGAPHRCYLQGAPCHCLIPCFCDGAGRISRRNMSWRFGTQAGPLP